MKTKILVRVSILYSSFFKPTQNGAQVLNLSQIDYFILIIIINASFYETKKGI